MAKIGKFRRATEIAASKMAKAAGVIEKRVKREVRRRKMRRVLKGAAETAMTAGAGILAAAAVEESIRVVRQRRKAANSLAMDAALPVAPELAIERVTAALKDEGFGVLTRIDANQVFEQKLGVAFRPYAILGACNPQLAHRSLSHNALVGLLLPCNVTVEAAAAGGSVIRIANPDAMLATLGPARDRVLEELMDEARGRLERVAAALRQ